MKEKFSWEAGALIEKAYQDEKGRMHVVAVASDDLTDLQSDQMSKAALDKMATDANSGIPLLDNHKATFEFGKSISGAVTSKKDENGKLAQVFVVDLELDASWPQSQALYKEVKSKQCQKQLSIGGKLNLKNPNAVTVEMTEKGLVRRINDLDLDHIACTRPKHAANPRTGFVSAIMKSLDDDPEMENVWKELEEKQNKEITEVDKNEVNGVEDEVAKEDVTMGINILRTVGRLFRKENGGDDMGGEDVRLKVEEEETTTPESSIDEDIANKVDEMLETAAPGVVAEEEEEKEEEDSWPMDDDEEKAEDLDEETTTEESTPLVEGEEEVVVEEPEEEEMKSDEDGMADNSNEEYVEDFEESETETATPEEEEAARVLMSLRRRRNQLAKQNDNKVNAEEVVREIAVLLSKANRINAGSKVEKDVLEAALWNARYLLAKQIMEKEDVAGGKAESDAATAIAAAIRDGGPYAPTTESAASAGVAGDKQSGATDMAASSVTDSRKLPTFAEGAEAEEKDAPTASESVSQMSAAANLASKLPQSNDVAEYGKSNNEQLDLLKNVGESIIAKSLDATQKMVLTATQKLAEVQKAQFNEISERLSSLENGGGVSQSGPRGAKDGEITKSKSTNGNGLWTGVFNGAGEKALSKM